MRKLALIPAMIMIAALAGCNASSPPAASETEAAPAADPSSAEPSSADATAAPSEVPDIKPTQGCTNPPCVKDQ